MSGIKAPSNDTAELQLAPHAVPTHPSTSNARIMTPQPPPPLTVLDDLGTEEPAQVSLH